uniref:hypothetical protein n=1 Tax=Brucella intermedia TaxID=94625 RepID=UPI002249088D
LAVVFAVSALGGAKASGMPVFLIPIDEPMHRDRDHSCGSNAIEFLVDPLVLRRGDRPPGHVPRPVPLHDGALAPIEAKGLGPLFRCRFSNSRDTCAAWHNNEKVND